MIARIARSRQAPRRGRPAALIGALCVCVLGAALVPGAAVGADSVYWSTPISSTILFANLDGSSSAPNEFVPKGATVANPEGLAIDPAAGRIYWANTGRSDISFANLDGSGWTELQTGMATVAAPAGIAIDPAVGTVYWANGAGPVSLAKVDGSGGMNLPTGSATLKEARGVAIDPAAGRIYWVSAGANTISVAGLDGKGGQDLPISGATVNFPVGIAVDHGAGRIYWANAGANTISSANLDGSAAKDLTISGATVANPEGLAIDPAAGRIYWANAASAGNISFANLDGSGGGVVAGTGGDHPKFPVLLRSPRPTEAPAIAGGSEIGSLLSCSNGAWAPDEVGSFLYQAPQGFAFQWSRNGRTIPGATRSSTKATAPGDYRCLVTARNFAGSRTQASAPHQVPPAFGKRTRVSLRLLGRVPARGPLAVQVINANAFRITGALSATRGRARFTAQKLRKRPSKRFSVGAHGKRTVKLRLPSSWLRLLARRHRLPLTLKANVADPLGAHRVLEQRIVAKLSRGGS
jgi:DNA-binding beta-propeller fold protein YncE